jgi:pyruvate/2-oxoglutarate dehydrogenase complex dihydrolipoamide dehydrogenase (E3) component
VIDQRQADALVAAIPALAPYDEHNRALAESVHPPEWTNPEPPREPYHLVVIGAGTAGLVTAAGAAGLGARVALVERHLLGGDCLNVGCVPSKALIRCARAAADARQAGEYGVRVEGVSVDFGAVMERMRRLRAKIAPNDSAGRFKGLGVDVYIGSAVFNADGSVQVGDTRLATKRAVIATGARATGLGIPGLNDAGFLTNETLFSLTELPRRLCVIGAGPIGCEMAQSFARFGSQVTLLEAAPQILIREDPDAARVVERALLADGIEILRAAKTLAVERRGDERVLRVEVEGAAREIVCDHILLGVGRAPNVEGLGLEGVGVGYDARAGVRVDEFMQTTNPSIFAAGDICSAYKFTHTADALARIVIQNALFSLGPFGRARSSSLTIPWCTYTDPEIAHVGLYEREAGDKGLEIDTIRIDLDDVDRAILDGDEGGLLKVHVEKGQDRILGATLVARHAGEMISEITLAMVSGAGMKTLAKTIHPYPTQAEAFKRAGDAFNRGRLTPTAKKFLDLVLRLKR